MHHWKKPIWPFNALSWILVFNRFGVSDGIQSELRTASGTKRNTGLAAWRALWVPGLSHHFQRLRVNASQFWARLSLHWAPNLVGVPVCNSPFWKPLPVRRPHLWFSALPSPQFRVGNCWWCGQSTVTSLSYCWFVKVHICLILCI